MIKTKWDLYLPILLGFMLIGMSCEVDQSIEPEQDQEWIRDASNPIYRDVYESENYESASDGHVFYDDNGQLSMIYSGDVNDRSSIKLAKGSSLTDWQLVKPLLSEPNDENTECT